MENALPYEFVEDLTAPEVFCSEVNVIGFDGPNMRIAFMSNRHSQEGERSVVKGVVVLRVVMSVPSVAHLRDSLSDMLDKAGLAATQRPAGKDLQ